MPAWRHKHRPKVRTHYRMRWWGHHDANVPFNLGVLAAHEGAGADYFELAPPRRWWNNRYKATGKLRTQASVRLLIERMREWTPAYAQAWRKKLDIRAARRRFDYARSVLLRDELVRDLMAACAKPADNDRTVYKYGLDPVTRKPVPMANVLEWGMWLDHAERQIRNTELPDGSRVSTVFLGLDHGFSGTGAPILFETKIFGVKHLEDYQRRYCTEEEAIAGHEEAINEIFIA